MSNIDWDFILKQEGGIKTVGYVPDAEGSQSGVTIGGGVDLGARDESDLSGLPDSIKAKLIPFLGLKGQDAVDVASSLKLSKAEAKTVTEWAKGGAVDTLRDRWKQATGESFDSLSKPKATIVASVAFQYGNLETETPNFWRQTTTGEWPEALQNLRNFGDKYPSRRNREADYLVENTSDQELKKKSDRYLGIPDLPSEDDAYDDSEMVSVSDRVVQESIDEIEQVSKGKLPDFPDTGDLGMPEEAGDVEPSEPAVREEPAQEITSDDVESVGSGKFADLPDLPDLPTLPKFTESSSLHTPVEDPQPRTPAQELYEKGGAIPAPLPSALVDTVPEPAPSEESLPSARINPNAFRPAIFEQVEMKEKSGFFETVGAMNAYQYAPIFNYLANKVAFRDEYEIGYNPLEDMEGYKEHEQFLLQAQNRNHMAYLKAEIDKNRERREVIHNATFGTQVAAGIFDPVNAIAIPFGFSGSFARSMLRSGTSVGTLQAGLEMARAPFDPLATPEESLYNIGGAFASGMVLGGLVSIPAAVRARGVKKTEQAVEEFKAQLEDKGLDKALLVGPTKERPFVNKPADALEVMIERYPLKLKALRKQLDEVLTDDYRAKLEEEYRDMYNNLPIEKRDPNFDIASEARRSQRNLADGIRRSITDYTKRGGDAKKELEVRDKEAKMLEEQGFGVEDPAGIAENAFTSSWLYKGVTTPVKRFLQSKALPTSVKLEMVRLAGDSGIMLNMHKVGLTNGSSVSQASQVHNGTWLMANSRLQELHAKDTNTQVRRFLDYDLTNIGRKVKNAALRGDEITYEKWLDNIGHLYVTGAKDLTPIQEESVAIVRRFFKDWEEPLREQGLIGDSIYHQNRVFALEDDLEVAIARANKAQLEKRGGSQEYYEARAARLEAELEEAKQILEFSRETRVRPANEEDMFPRFWNKEYVKENRAALEQILYDWYLKNPFVYTRNQATGKYERTRLDPSPEGTMARAKKSVDEILEITDVTDDANAFFGYGKSKHFRHRSIDIPNALVAQFIATNPVKVMKTYTARVAPKYEFARKFGGRNIEDVLDDMTHDMYESGMTTRQVHAARKDFRHMYDRVAGSVLRDPEAMSQRIANVMRFGAETNYLGSAGFSTLPDAAKLVMEHEMGTLGKVLLTLLEKDSFVKHMSAKEGKMSGEIAEIEMGAAHMRMVEDLLNNPLEQGILDKGRNIAYTLNLLAPMTNTMKRIESLARGHTIIDYSVKWANGKATDFEKQYLARYNIDEARATEIAGSPWQQSASGLYLPNTDVWKDAIQFPATYGKSTSGPTGKFAGDRYVFSTYNKRTKTITVDEDYIRETAFPAKAWTKPTVAGANPMDVDAIRTPQEYINFAYMKEYMKLKNPAKDLGIALNKKGGKAEYEEVLNDLALAEMKKQTKVSGETVQSFREAMNSGIMNTILMGTPADKPIITDGVVYVPMHVVKKMGLSKFVKEDQQYTGYARVENAFVGMPFQFMSYSFAAANKITAAYSQGQIRNRAYGVMTSLALGYAVLKIKTPDFVWDEMSYRDKFARSFDASGLAALYSDMFYESLTMSSAFDVPNITNGYIQPKFPEDDPYGAVIGGIGGAGPSIAYDQVNAVREFISGEYGEGAKNFVRELPYMRLWFFRDFMNEMTRGWAR